MSNITPAPKRDPFGRLDAYRLDAYTVPTKRGAGVVVAAAITAALTTSAAAAAPTTVEPNQTRAISTTLDGAVFPAALARIHRFSALAPGWDGPESVAPSKTATRTARTVLAAFEASVLYVTVSKEPQVAPRSDGGYLFEWHNGTREFYVGCDNDGALDFLEVAPDHEREYLGGPVELSAALGWFLEA